MHPTSYNEMKVLVGPITPKGTVVDVGSYNVNGCFKTLFNGWKYIGVDISPGPNVDLVIEQYHIPLENVDLVVSGSCLEHEPRPWLMINEMYRILKPGGQCFINAPASIAEHRYPIDCWRFLPDGLAVIMQDAGFKDIKTYIKPDNSMKSYSKYSIIDCWGIGTK